MSALAGLPARGEGVAGGCGAVWRRGALSMADRPGDALHEDADVVPDEADAGCWTAGAASDEPDDGRDAGWLTAGRRCVDEEDDAAGATADSCSWMSIMWSPRRIVRLSGALPDRKSFTW